MLNIFRKKSLPVQKTSVKEQKPIENQNAKAAAENNGLARRPVRQSLGVGGSLGEGGRRLEGVVVSNKMKKTVVVAITRLKLQPKYKKYFKVTRRFKVHDENNECRVGDKVVMQETRPISKDKRWIVTEKLK